jgi:hypothetical protein
MPKPVIKSRTSGTLRSEYNAWGTKKSDINPDEYCVECEQDTRRGHYEFCPKLEEMGVE